MTAEEVLKDVSTRFDVKPEAIRGRSRLRHIVAARHAWWLGLRELGWSFPAIGVESMVDHTSVMSGCKKAERARSGLGEGRYEPSAAENMHAAGLLIVKAMRQMLHAGVKRDLVFKELNDLFARARKEVWS